MPLGVFLSGGIDSTAILALAARHRPPAEIDTFTIGFRESSFDESAYAELAAERFGSRHHRDVCELADAKSIIPTLLARLDEPIGDSSIVPTHLLCAFARRSVTVALSGDGGDELFAGYDPFRALGIANAVHRVLPRGTGAILGWLAGLLPQSDRNMSMDLKIRRGLRGVRYSPELWNPVWLAPLDPEEIAACFNTVIDPEELYSEAIALWRESDSDSLVDRTLEFYTNFYLCDNILAKIDRASMLVSLETRAPFLDIDLVDFVRRVPHQFKLRGGETKFLLKRALRGIVPDTILDRPKKGFGIPLSQWLREMSPPSPQSIPYVDRAWFQEGWRRHRDRQVDLRYALWCWLGVEHHMTARTARSQASSRLTGSANDDQPRASERGKSRQPIIEPR